MLSAYYDGALDRVESTQEDPLSLIREQLVLEEASRRRSTRYLEAKAMVLGGSALDSKSRNKLLLETLEQARGCQFPWTVKETDGKDREKTENEQLADYYHKVMAAYKKHRQKQREKQAAEKKV